MCVGDLHQNCIIFAFQCRRWFRLRGKFSSRCRMKRNRFVRMQTAKRKKCKKMRFFATPKKSFWGFFFILLSVLKHLFVAFPFARCRASLLRHENSQMLLFAFKAPPLVEVEFSEIDWLSLLSGQSCVCVQQLLTP